MTIKINTIRPRKRNRQHVDITIDGQPWAHGSVPGDLDEAGVLAWLEGQEETMRGDMERAAEAGRE